MKAPNIKQFKLTNDDEIICEVLEWDNPENASIIMRGALKVMESHDFQKGIRFFGFKPWMSFIDDPEMLQSLNSSHIIGEITPEDKLIKFYIKTILDLKRYKRDNKNKMDVNIDEIQEALEVLSDEELEDYLNDKMISEKNIFNPDILDSDQSNIIQFKPKNTIH